VSLERTRVSLTRLYHLAGASRAGWLPCAAELSPAAAAAGGTRYSIMMAGFPAQSMFSRVFGVG